MSLDSVDSIDKTVQKTYQWVDAVGAELGDSATRRQSYSILRGLLQTLRDRLPVDEAADLAAQLPELLRGVYYEGWDPSKAPHKLSGDEFLSRFAGMANLPSGIEPSTAMRAGMRVLHGQITQGEMADVMQILPGDLRAMLEA